MAKRKKTTRRSPAETSSSRGAKKSVKKKTTKRTPAPKKTDGKQRLQRVMAQAGVASRRECEIIIQEGRVEVDGQIIVELGHKVDPAKQEIYVDAQKLRIERLQYFILNKPPGVLSTSNDPSGRPRVIDLIDTRQRVFNVGRLDQSSEGLILVTNDGDLANKLTHPRYGVEKKYHVQVDGQPKPADLRKLKEGIYIAEGRVRASNIRFLKKAGTNSWLEIILDEGRNREIRRMLAAIGHKVRVLKRVAIGPLKLADLPKGAHRPLTSHELRSLQKATEGGAKKKKRSKKRVAKQSSTDAATRKKRSSKKVGGVKKKTSSKKSSSKRDAKGKTTKGSGRRMARTAKAPRKPRRK
jgi:23S rRNA pseudouridine2605 synthase